MSCKILCRFIRQLSQIEDVVATDKDFAEHTVGLAILELFCVGQLQVHVAICADEETLVFHAPFQAHQDRLARLQLEEWFWVYWLELRKGERSSQANVV